MELQWILSQAKTKDASFGPKSIVVRAHSFSLEQMTMLESDLKDRRRLD